MVGDEDTVGSVGTVSARIESSYIINLRDLDMKHVKDIVFVHGEYHWLVLAGFIMVHGCSGDSNKCKFCLLEELLLFFIDLIV